jgi:hypothetical protein
MQMRDVEIGTLVFLHEDMSDESSREVRETYYVRTGEATYNRLGVIQGDPNLATAQYEDGRAVRPRYIRFDPIGYEYPLVGALPVRPASESRFLQYVMPGPLAAAG